MSTTLCDAQGSAISQQIQPIRRGSAHIATLDGLRGLAILLVMLYHQCVMNPAVTMDRVVARAFGFGWCGVDLFFVLSGFLITGILVDTKGSPGYLRTFYARRTLRIFPLYYSVVFLSFVVLPLIPHAKSASFGRIDGDELWYWTYLSNFSIAQAGAWRHGILDISWSLAIEEQFYMLWPLMVLMLPRAGLRKLCIAVFAGALLFRISLVMCGASAISVYVLTPSRIDALALGAWIAVASRDWQGGIHGLARIASKLIIPLGAGIFALAACSESQYSSEAPLMQTIGYSAFSFFFGALLLRVATAEPGGRCHTLFSSVPMCALGKYSYALYLFHLPLRALVRDTILPPESFPTVLGSRIPGQLMFFVLSSALTFLAAWLSWNLYEKHFLRAKRFFEYSPQDREQRRTGT